VHSEGYLNFLPEVVIWWTLNMYFWKIVNTLLELYMQLYSPYINSSKKIYKKREREKGITMENKHK